MSAAIARNLMLFILYIFPPCGFFPRMAKQCLISYLSQAHPLALFDASSVFLRLIFLPLLSLYTATSSLPYSNGLIGAF